MEFFLQGVLETAIDAQGRARQIVALREKHRTEIADRRDTSAGRAFRLLDRLYKRPYVTISQAATDLEVSFPTATRLIEALEQAGMLVEATGQKRDRIYVYQPYIDIFSDRS